MSTMSVILRVGIFDKKKKRNDLIDMRALLKHQSMLAWLIAERPLNGSCADVKIMDLWTGTSGCLMFYEVEIRL